MKEKILGCLRRAGGEYLSGEEMSRLLGVSRAAVWKAVRKLQEEGYPVEAVTGRGYRLSGGPEKLTPGNILPRLEGLRPERLICLESVDSTNNYAKRIALQGAPDRTVIVSDEQTGGRGRRGRSFYSPKGTGLYLSYLTYPEASAEKVSRFTACAAVAVTEAVRKACGLETEIKWPNDILCRGRKLCGILTELALEGESGQLQYMICGIGINLLQKEEDFPEEIRQTAGSLAMMCGETPSRLELTAALIGELDRVYAGWHENDPALLQRFRERCGTVGRDILVLSGSEGKEAFAEGIAEDFGLIVRYPDGTKETLRAGEVSVRKRGS